jgi:hypothetical protein
MIGGLLLLLPPLLLLLLVVGKLLPGCTGQGKLAELPKPLQTNSI